MDFRERLLKNEIRNLNDSLRTISDELMLLKDFVDHEFGSQFKKFIQRRASVDKMVMVRPKYFSKANKSTTERVTSFVASPKIRAPKIKISSPEMQPADDHEVNQDPSSSDDADFFFVPNPECLLLNQNEDYHEEEENTLNIDQSLKPLARDLTSNSSFQSESDSDWDGIKSKAKKRKKSHVRRKDNRGSERKHKTINKAPGKCPICEVATDHSERNTHIQTHTLEEANEKFVCQICCTVYDLETTFLKHKDKVNLNGSCKSDDDDYENAKLIKCQKRIQHEKSHSGKGPFPCSMCPEKFFSRKDSLTRHIHRFHN